MSNLALSNLIAWATAAVVALIALIAILRLPREIREYAADQRQRAEHEEAVRLRKLEIEQRRIRMAAVPSAQRVKRARKAKTELRLVVSKK